MVGTSLLNVARPDVRAAYSLDSTYTVSGFGMTVTRQGALTFTVCARSPAVSANAFRYVASVTRTITVQTPATPTLTRTSTATYTPTRTPSRTPIPTFTPTSTQIICGSGASVLDASQAQLQGTGTPPVCPPIATLTPTATATATLLPTIVLGVCNVVINANLASRLSPTRNSPRVNTIPSGTSVTAVYRLNVGQDIWYQASYMGADGWIAAAIGGTIYVDIAYSYQQHIGVPNQYGIITYRPTYNSVVQPLLSTVRAPDSIGTPLGYLWITKTYQQSANMQHIPR